MPGQEDPATHFGWIGDPRRRRCKPRAPYLRTERRARLLPLSVPIVVYVVGAPVACARDAKDTWRAATTWVASQLVAHFGEAVQVEYVDLFDPACPPLPPNAQLPMIYINGRLFSSGGKVNGPAIRAQIEELLQAGQATE